MGIGARFLDLLEHSVIVQSLLPLAFAGAAIALWLQGREVPEPLLHILWACVAFWMGSKVQYLVDNRRQSRYDH